MNNSLTLMEGVVSGLDCVVLVDPHFKTESVSDLPSQPPSPLTKPYEVLIA